MDVGSDYLLYQRRQRPGSHQPLGIALLVVGVVLITITGAYYGYATYARSQLDALNTSSAGLTTSAEPTAPVAPQEGQPLASYLLPLQAGVALYPARAIRAQDWGNPLWAENPGATSGSRILAQYQPVSWNALPPSAMLPPPLRMKIPAIGVDAPVEGLQINDLGDSRAYETPKFTVGYIPETTNPGAAGNGWYFGHLQSPIKQEGAIFKDLPKLPPLVREGEKVYIIVESGVGSYLYQVTRTWVIPGDELVITPSSEPTITLVTCVPAWDYRDRLLVEAKLVGARPIQ